MTSATPLSRHAPLQRRDEVVRAESRGGVLAVSHERENLDCFGFWGEKASVRVRININSIHIHKPRSIRPHDPAPLPP